MHNKSFKQLGASLVLVVHGWLVCACTIDHFLLHACDSMVCTVSFMMCCFSHNGCIPLGSGSVIWDHLDHSCRSKEPMNPFPDWICWFRWWGLLGLIPTSNMALKQWHNAAEMMTNDTKMAWNCDRDRERHKYNCKIPTATWLLPQYAKQQVLKFRLRDIRNPPRGAFLLHHDLSDLRSLILIQVISVEHTQGFFQPLFLLSLLLFQYWYVFQCDGCLFLFPFSGGWWPGCTFVPEPWEQFNPGADCQKWKSLPYSRHPTPL